MNQKLFEDLCGSIEEAGKRSEKKLRMNRVVTYGERSFVLNSVWSEEDEGYVATCKQFPSLSFLDPSQEDSLDGLEDVVLGVLLDLDQE